MKIKTKQETNYKGNNWWQWSLWLEGAEDELDKIAQVVYTLHPTFPTPTRKIDNRNSKFRLDSAGWGEFEIYIDLILKTGNHSYLNHWLKLEYPAPKNTPSQKRAPLNKEIKEMPAVFISGSMADISITQALRDKLISNGLEVMTMEDAPNGLPWEKSVSAMLQRAVAAVFVISEWSSPFAIREIESALEQRVGLIVPILVGQNAQLPKELDHLQSIKLKDMSEFESAAKQLIDMGMSQS